MSVLGFAIWIAATNAFANSAYTAAASYNASFLAVGFLVARRTGAQGAGVLLGAAIALTVGLAGWALWQRMAGEARGHAGFETPATMAAVINLVLLPGLVVLASSRRNAWLAVGVVILAAGLIAAGSRGGWLSFAVGLLACSVFARRAKLPVDFRAIAVVGCLGWVLSWLVPMAWDWLPNGVLGTPLSVAVNVSQPGHSMIGADAVQSSIGRLGLYELAVRGILAAPLAMGDGYLSFYYMMEVARQGVATFGTNTTYFVHNDYLQTLLELGLPGLLGLLAIVAVPLIGAWRALPRLSGRPIERMIVVAMAAAITTMATHAVVDFPFYIPLCLLLYGGALGLLDASLSPSYLQGPSAFAQGPRQVQRLVAVACATLAAWILAMPAAAELAAAHANRRWSAADATGAAFWFEAARRIEPKDWRYHWYAGQFWFSQAAQHRKPEAGRFADRAFADGDAANPRQVRNLIGRIATHRQLRELLAGPADDATLRAWADRAVALAPLDAGAHAARDRVYAQRSTPQGAKLQ